MVGDDDRLALRRGRLVADIEHVGGGRSRRGRLGEDRRRVAGDAEIERAERHRLQHLRAGGMLAPLHPVTLAGERLVEKAGVLEDDQRAVALVADADGPAAGRTRPARRHGSGGGKSEYRAECGSPGRRPGRQGGHRRVSRGLRLRLRLSCVA